MRKNTKRGLTSLLVVSMLVVALVSGLAMAVEEEPAAEAALASDTTAAEQTTEAESENQPGICPVTGEPAMHDGEAYQRNQRFGMSEGAKGEGIGEQLRQQVQIKDGACIDNPELMAERQAAREARQAERGERQQGRGRMAQNNVQGNAPDA